MSSVMNLENIEEMRRQEGIDDVDLRVEIRSLKVGDFVKLTFVTGPTAFETAWVRVTKIRGTAFRGKLLKRPASNTLAQIKEGASIAFTSAHVHSLMKRHAVRGRDFSR